MSPPPATPSPHRFVIKKERPFRNTPLAQSQTPSRQQFNATPRFTSRQPVTQGATVQNVPRTTPAALRYLGPGHQTPKEQEIIEDRADGILLDVHDSIETNERDSDYGSAEDDDYEIEEPTSKRRRLSSSPKDDSDIEGGKTSGDDIDSLSSSIPVLSSPPAPRRPTSSHASKFLLSTPALQSTSQTLESTQTPFQKPPRFRPPDPSEVEKDHVDPLPEHFSPHRKGQKYMVGGLAAEVRDWLMNLESALPVNLAQKRDSDPWIVRIVVDELSGSARDGMTLVRGRQVHSTYEGNVGNIVDVMKVILAGEGQHAGLQKGAPVEVGKIVGIKGPLWEVVVEGAKWGVGVDWKVLTS